MVYLPTIWLKFMEFMVNVYSTYTISYGFWLSKSMVFVIGDGSGKDWDMDLSQIPVEQPFSKYTVDGSEILL